MCLKVTQREAAVTVVNSRTRYVDLYRFCRTLVVVLNLNFEGAFGWVVDML